MPAVAVAVAVAGPGTGSGLDSGVVGGAGRFSHTFPSTRTFAYICGIHPEMRAVAAVRSGSGNEGASPSRTALLLGSSVEPPSWPAPVRCSTPGAGCWPPARRVLMSEP